MARYRFRFFFEWGCGEDYCPCLWGIDDITKNRFGYEVDLKSFPISNDLKKFLFELGIKHDESLDWDNPANPTTLWSKDEEEQFYKNAHKAYEKLLKELGDDYEIIYCEYK
jgi:hypothetical protein